MPDISKCYGENCKSKYQCYRFTAHGSFYQSYMNFEENIEGDKCPDFWDNTEYEKSKLLKAKEELFKQ